MADDVSSYMLQIRYTKRHVLLTKKTMRRGIFRQSAWDLELHARRHWPGKGFGRATVYSIGLGYELFTVVKNSTADVALLVDRQ